mgnify:CR=1
MSMTPYQSGYNTNYDFLIALDCASAKGKHVFVCADVGNADRPTADFLTVRDGLVVYAVDIHS